MSVQSLAIVFGPTLLRPQVESPNMTIHMVFQSQIVELILNEFQNVFPAPGSWVWVHHIFQVLKQPSWPELSPVLHHMSWTYRNVDVVFFPPGIRHQKLNELWEHIFYSRESIHWQLRREELHVSNVATSSEDRNYCQEHFGVINISIATSIVPERIIFKNKGHHVFY